MLRVNLTIAIVSMVTPDNSSSEHSHSNESLSVADECAGRTMTNDLTPINDTRTPAIHVDVNRVNETNNATTLLSSFPQWHPVRWDSRKVELARLTTPSIVHGRVLTFKCLFYLYSRLIYYREINVKFIHANLITINLYKICNSFEFKINCFAWILNRLSLYLFFSLNFALL